MKAIQKKSKLTYQLYSQSDLSKQERSRMFHLMEANYDCVSRYQFEKDLEQKQEKSKGAKQKVS